MLSKDQSSYTILILPDSAAKPHIFSIRKKTLRYSVRFLLIVLLGLALFFGHSLSLLNDVAELALLRDKTKKQDGQIRSVLNTLDHLKQQMVPLMELDRKLRIITDLPAMPRTMNNTAPMGGQGGPEECLTPSSRCLSAKQNGQKWQRQRLELVQQELEYFGWQIEEERESFETLVAAISDMKLRWEKTPSIWPVKGFITSSFGPRVSPFTGEIVMHNGIDIAARRGVPLVAPATGIVRSVRQTQALGKSIVIDHDYGKVTVFGHLDRWAVRADQPVQRGTVIGYVGNTGLSTGSHLHYETHVNGIPVDPTRYLLN